MLSISGLPPVQPGHGGLHRIRLRGLSARVRTLSKSLRFQLTFRVLVILGPAFLISEAVISQLASNQILKLTQSRMRTDSQLLSFALHKWGSSTRLMLASLAYNQSLRDRNIPEIERLFRGLGVLYPHREWRYWSADAQPRLLVSTGNIGDEGRRRAERNILNRGYFQAALNGIPSYSVVKSYASSQVCLMVAQPVYAQPSEPSDLIIPGPQRPPKPQPVVTAAPVSGSKPTGVLLSCILLDKLSVDTGLRQQLQALDQDMGAVDLTSEEIKGDQFATNKPFKSLLLLASRHGHILYPTSEKLATDSIPILADYLRGYWQPLFRVIKKAAVGQEAFERVQVGRDYYYVMINQADEAWSTVLIVNEQQVFDTIQQLRTTLQVSALILVGLVALGVQWGCGRITAPIESAGKALEAISEGDFDTHIKHQRDDEIGSLLNNINRTSEQLKNFLAKETAHAITQKQLETANRIQKDFLVSEMPVSDKLEIAPIFLPCYEVGADWYDALKLNKIIYIVVADVCDKGIPSSLYMSVFRSLIRYGLLNCSEAITNPGERLQNVIMLTNDYMATNHGDSAMFATTFLAAIDPENKQLYYISGGHEPSLICRLEGSQWLQPTGPAVGIFAGATYTYCKLDLRANDYIVAYTDGLVDARSPEGRGWGTNSLGAFMDERRGGSASAQDVLDQLLQTVSAHSRDAERFDDLTVMVLRLLA